MYGISFVTLLLTGLCISFASEQNYTYIFINETMTWDAARKYCINHHIELAQTDSYKVLNTAAITQNAGHAQKAWIGLIEGLSGWTWINGTDFMPVEWRNSLRFAGISEDCAFMDEDDVETADCSQKMYFICQDYKGVLGTMDPTLRLNWNDAQSSCRERNMKLLTISNDDEFRTAAHAADDHELWLGLRKTKVWAWSHIGGAVPEMEEPPEEFPKGDRCGAILLNNQTAPNTLAAEDCSNTYPFFCYDISKVDEVKRTVLKLQIKSNANLEDPVGRAELLQQLRSSFANHSLGDVKLTWKKVPEKKVKHESPCD